MAILKKERPKKKVHQLELDLMGALIHPEDGEQRRRYVKRFLYGEEQIKKETAEY